jgi:hypothetical protein
MKVTVEVGTRTVNRQRAPGMGSFGAALLADPKRIKRWKMW